jgi:hypothetical protein
LENCDEYEVIQQRYPKDNLECSKLKSRSSQVSKDSSLHSIENSKDKFSIAYISPKKKRRNVRTPAFKKESNLDIISENSKVFDSDKEDKEDIKESSVMLRHNKRRIANSSYS